MNEELISIIVPAYNAESYLRNCLDSIIKQTYRCYEVLLVDDGSTDNTGIIADQYRSSFPDYIRVIHTNNQGVTKARFEGIMASKGDWIGFVDADDEIEPDMYERLFHNALQYDAEISHCGHVTIVNNGERIHEFYNTGQLLLQKREEGLLELLDGIFEPSLCTKLFRKRLIRELVEDNKMLMSVKYYEDLLMNYYLFKKAECSVYEDFCGYHYLAHNITATRSPFCIEKVLDPVAVHKVILKDIDSKFKDLATKQYLEVCIRAYAALSYRDEYNYQADEIKEELIKFKSSWELLNRNDRIKLNTLFFSPKMYNKLYGIYRRFFQNKIYE